MAGHFYLYKYCNAGCVDFLFFGSLPEFCRMRELVCVGVRGIKGCSFPRRVSEADVSYCSAENTKKQKNRDTACV